MNSHNQELISHRFGHCCGHIAASEKDADNAAVCSTLSALQRTRAGGEGYSGDSARELSIHGVEKTDETRRLCRLNLAPRGIEADFGPEHDDAFRRVLHPAPPAPTTLSISRA